MKIAIFSDNFYPELSGIADSITTTGKQLAKLGHKINFVALDYSAKNFQTIGAEKKELELGEGVFVTRIPSVPYPTGTKQSRLTAPIGLSLRAMKKFDPDVIHTNDIASLGLEALLCARILKKPLVGTDHTPMVEFLKYSPIKGKIIQKTVSRYDAWYYNQCSFVSSPCNAIFTELKKYGFGKPKHRALSNPINIEKYKPVRNKWPLKKKFELFDYSILYMGRIASEKKIDITIKAVANLVKKVPKLGLVIAGTGAQVDELKALVEQLGIERNVKFFGYLKNIDDMVGLYNGSDLFVIPSVAETQSIVMMQAMACKLPVIAARAWGLAEYVNDKNGILIEPDDAEGLTQKILYLFENQGVALKLGEGGREFVEKFSPENIAREWERIYIDVIESFNSSR
jgi:glycosyltransferase involved in cell wall biosynthesis